MSIKPKYKEMKTKIIYTIVFLMIAKLAYSQEEQYSADKFVAKCPNEIFIGEYWKPTASIKTHISS